MQRREFLRTSVTLAAGVMRPAGRSMAAFDPSPENGWRVFDVATRVEVLRPDSATRAWLPLSSVQEDSWMRALYVGLARAAGLPARDVYGIRVADSRFGYKSLGKRGDIGKARHCRAEVWLTAHDMPLPGLRKVAVPFLMYPQAETAAGMLDSLDPATFSYRIASKDIAPS